MILSNCHTSCSQRCCLRGSQQRTKLQVKRASSEHGFSDTLSVFWMKVLSFNILEKSVRNKINPYLRLYQLQI